MKILAISAALIAGLSVSTAVMAQPAAPATATEQPAAAAPSLKVRSGQGIYSSDGGLLGHIDYVETAKDGTPMYVGVIRDTQIVHIPANSLSTGPKGVTTSLTRADFSRLK